MGLERLYFHDPRLTLIPIEHLSRRGMSDEFAAMVSVERGWDDRRTEFFDTAFALYYERSRLLAHTGTWSAPRIRHVAIVEDPMAVRPYVQLLNTSAWTLYACDFDPDVSHPEFAAYLLVHGDCMAETGEVAPAAVRTAAYWLERTDEECEAFATAAAASTRPDAAGFRAVAKATRWMRKLHHESLRPLVVSMPHRTIPGTGLIVLRDAEEEPPKLVQRWRKAAERSLRTYSGHWKGGDLAAVDELCRWLAEETPPLLMMDRAQVAWDPQTPQATRRLRAVLKQADRVSVQSVAEDLRVVAAHTTRFRAAVAEPEALPEPPSEMEHSGYTYLHRERGMIAYDLRERGMERLAGPDLPYARAMLGARTAHEWAHLAVIAGWVPRTVSDDRFAELTGALASELESTIAAAPMRIIRATTSDLAGIAPGKAPGEALAALLLERTSDYQSNLLAWCFMTEIERETYVRHNVRTLRPFYTPAQAWRMLVRYLYEYQYLGLSAVEDKRAYFLRSTWFDIDFIASGLLDQARFDTLAAAVAALCASHAVDETRIKPPS